MKTKCKPCTKLLGALKTALSIIDDIEQGDFALESKWVREEISRLNKIAQTKGNPHA